MNIGTTVGVIVWGLGVGMGAIGAWHIQDTRLRLQAAQFAQEQAEQDQAAADIAQIGLQRLQRAQDEADRIDADAQHRVQRQQRQLQELKNALKTATTGRPCLSGAAVGLLNSAQQTDTLPADTMPNAPPALAESTAQVATDTDIADWIAHAQQQYDLCRGRIDDLNRWWQQQSSFEPLHTPTIQMGETTNGR